MRHPRLGTRLAAASSQGRVAAVVLATSLLAIGCGDAPTPGDEPAPQSAPHGHEHAGHTHGPAEPVDAYDSIVANIQARGDAGAREAWATDQATVLLFAASW